MEDVKCREEILELVLACQGSTYATAFNITKALFNIVMNMWPSQNSIKFNVMSLVNDSKHHSHKRLQLHICIYKYRYIYILNNKVFTSMRRFIFKLGIKRYLVLLVVF